MVYEFEHNNKKIRKIYIGIPDSFNGIINWIGREKRINDLSFIPGGEDIIIQYQNGNILGYDWVKYPSSYIKAIFSHTILENLKELGTNRMLIAIKQKVFKIFTGTIVAEKEDEASLTQTIEIKEIWDTNTSKKLPWEYAKENQSESNDIRYTPAFYRYLDYATNPNRRLFLPEKTLVTIATGNYEIEISEYALWGLKKIKITEAVFRLENINFRIPYRLGVVPDIEMDLEISTFIKVGLPIKNSQKQASTEREKIVLAGNS